MNTEPNKESSERVVALGLCPAKKLIVIIRVCCILYHGNTMLKRIVRGWGGMEFTVQKFNINKLSFCIVLL